MSQVQKPKKQVKKSFSGKQASKKLQLRVNDFFAGHFSGLLLRFSQLRYLDKFHLREIAIPRLKPLKP
jgi:hypothetical protein